MKSKIFATIYIIPSKKIFSKTEKGIYIFCQKYYNVLTINKPYT